MAEPNHRDLNAVILLFVGVNALFTVMFLEIWRTKLFAIKEAYWDCWTAYKFIWARKDHQSVIIYNLFVWENNWLFRTYQSIVLFTYYYINPSLQILVSLIIEYLWINSSPRMLVPIKWVFKWINNRSKRINKVRVFYFSRANIHHINSLSL